MMQKNILHSLKHGDIIRKVFNQNKRIFVLELNLPKKEVYCKICNKPIIDELPIFCSIEKAFYHKECIGRKETNHIKGIIPRNFRHEDHPVLIKWK